MAQTPAERAASIANLAKARSSVSLRLAHDHGLTAVKKTTFHSHKVRVGHFRTISIHGPRAAAHRGKPKLSRY